MNRSRVSCGPALLVTVALFVGCENQEQSRSQPSARSSQEISVKSSAPAGSVAVSPSMPTRSPSAPAVGSTPPAQPSAVSSLEPSTLRKFKPVVPKKYRPDHEWTEVMATNGHVAWELRSTRADGGAARHKLDLEDYTRKVKANQAPMLTENVNDYRGYKYVIGYDGMEMLVKNMWLRCTSLRGDAILTPEDLEIDAKGLAAL